MSDILAQLRDKETTLANLREQESRRQGREEQLLKQLQTQFKLNTIEEAQQLHQQLVAKQADCTQRLTVLDTEMAGIIEAAQTSKEAKVCG